MASLVQEAAAGNPRDRTALDAFLRIAELWELTADQQITLLGSPGRSTFFKWKKDGGALPSDTLERISHIFNIYKCLNILFPDPARADAWVRRPNRFWNEQSALDRMLVGTMADLIEVRRYLDAQRGG
jgi:hypothetical protein